MPKVMFNRKEYGRAIPVEYEKYVAGLGIDQVLGTLSTGGALNQSTTPLDVELTGVKSLGAYVLYGKFYNSTAVRSFSAPDLSTIYQEALAHTFQECSNLAGEISFPLLTTVQVSGLESAFTGTKITKLSFPRLVSVLGMTAFRNLAWNVKTLTEINFENLSTIYNWAAFDTAFQGTGLVNVSFPKLTTINQNATRAFAYAFAYTQSLKTAHFDAIVDASTAEIFTNAFSGSSVEEVTFNSLETASGEEAFSNMFHQALNLETVSFPALTTISDTSNGVFRYAFYNSTIRNMNMPELVSVGRYGLCFALQSTAVETLSLPKLETVGEYGLEGILMDSTDVKSVSLPALKSVGRYGLMQAFYNCGKLTSLSFPSLQEIDPTAFEAMCVGCYAITEIHFRADAQAAVEATNGYANKWDAPNATIYFDL